MSGENVVDYQAITLPCFTAAQLAAMVGVPQGSFVFDTTNNVPAVYSGGWKRFVNGE